MISPITAASTISTRTIPATASERSFTVLRIFTFCLCVKDSKQLVVS
jgi:hypothetical protein